MSLYDINLEVFKKNSPTLYEKLTVHEPSRHLKIEVFDEAQNYRVSYGNVTTFVHSLYSVEEEMAQMFRGIGPEDKIAIFFGLGYGHAIDYLKRNHKNLERIIIIEPSLELFKETMKHVDLFKVGEGLKITFLIDEKPEDLGKTLGHFLSKTPHYNLSYNLAYRTLFSDYFLAFEIILTKYIKAYLANLHLVRTTNKQWLYNSIHNFKHKSLAIEDLANYFEGKAVVIVGAGPSLNKNMHLIPELRKKAIVVAVGSAIRVLEKNNIIPDARMAYDGSPLEMKVIDSVENFDVPLIYSNRLYHEFLEKHTGPSIRMVIDSDSISRYILDHAEMPYMPIRTAPSISAVAADLMCRLKASKVILMGQDLCFYPDGIRYASGGNHKGENIDFSNSMYVEDKDIYGNLVYTYIGFQLIQESFKPIVENYGIPLINATEGGLNLEGIVNMTLADVLEKELPMTFEESFANLVAGKLTEMNHLAYNEMLEKGFQAMLEDLGEIEKINVARLKWLKKILKTFDKNYSPSKMALMVSDLDRFEKELQEVDLYSQEIYASLSMIFSSIKGINEYHGTEQKPSIEAAFKTVLGYTTEVELYAFLLREILKRFDVYSKVEETTDAVLN